MGGGGRPRAGTGKVTFKKKDRGGGQNTKESTMPGLVINN